MISVLVHSGADASSLRVLQSRCVFTATSDEAFDGFIAVRGNRIEAVGSAADAAPYVKAADEVIDFGDRTLMPGLVDVHTFYTGWQFRRTGANLLDVENTAEIVSRLVQWRAQDGLRAFALGQNLPSSFAEGEAADELKALLDAEFGDVPVVVFAEEASTCVLNTAAYARYGFSPDACYAEMIWRLLADVLSLPESRAGYDDYMALLNERGVTAIKEMAFDDYYGFVDEMARREDAGELSVRVSMMSQPVGKPANIVYGRAARDRFQGAFVRFSGYNRMTDRGVWAGLAEMIEPYEQGADIAAGKTVAVDPEWSLISSELAAVDAEGFRYSLHCLGDGAVRHTVDLLEDMPRDVEGKLINRHAITDLENSDPSDLVRFGAMGGICEVYPQILTLDAREDCLSMMRRQIGQDRLLHSWNRRGMADAGCVVSCGTDLPLLLPSIGESIFSACGGFFADGLSANEGNTLSVAELLRAWTAGGAYDLIREDDFGTLEPGKLADVCVLSENAFSVNPAEARRLEVDLTMVDGRVVYQRRA